jgi:hypothetical protein
MYRNFSGVAPRAEKKQKKHWCFADLIGDRSSSRNSSRRSSRSSRSRTGAKEAKAIYKASLR